jgi:hypothetical protein
MSVNLWLAELSSQLVGGHATPQGAGLSKEEFGVIDGHYGC